MSRRFRLAAVERLRTEQLEAAARALATANGVLRAAQQERERLAAELSGGPPEKLTTAADAQLASVYRDRLRKDLLDADIQLQQREQEAGRARQGWLAAKGGVRAVEALHSRHVLAWQQARQGWLAAKGGVRAVEALHTRHVLAWQEADRRTEQKELDDLASARAIDNARGRR